MAAIFTQEFTQELSQELADSMVFRSPLHQIPQEFFGIRIVDVGYVNGSICVEFEHGKKIWFNFISPVADFFSSTNFETDCETYLEIDCLNGSKLNTIFHFGSYSPNHDWYVHRFVIVGELQRLNFYFNNMHKDLVYSMRIEQ